MLNFLKSPRARVASLLLTATVLLPGVAMAHMGSESVMVGGQAMMPSKNIIENAVNSADHTTLVAAVKAAGLVQTLEGKGPFTVFAPTNEAFSELPAGTVDSLLQPDNKGKLVKILTYHVVPGRLDFEALKHKIHEGGGEAKLKTVSGGTLTAKMNGEHNIVLEDEMGHYAHISTYDVYQSNGVIQVIDHVLMPM
jgi:uncharacterized surface protein with fasciclin (FAS1) repeats